jgi:hypothetical protein
MQKNPKAGPGVPLPGFKPLRQQLLIASMMVSVMISVMI